MIGGGITGRPSTRLLRLAWALAILGSLSAGAGDKPRREQEPRTPRQESRSSFELERDAAIERARSEIRKNPSQKKFILFRYGLDEKDLR